MKTYVIVTNEQDLHAAIVATALDRLGERCVRWNTARQARAETAVRLPATPGPGGPHWTLDLGAGRLPADLVVWNRRIERDPRPDGELTEADRIVAQREHRAFVDGAVALLNTAATRINDAYAAARAENKALQLAAAGRAGLATPETLITNAPEQIRQFVAVHEAEGVIAKPFSPTVWASDDGEFVGRSARVTAAMLPDDRLLRACPMIFQTYVPKRFEVRVTCFGPTLVAARLDSQAHESSQVDWRAISPRRLAIEPIELPEAVRAGCAALLEDLGLAFGCIDMVVTPAGEWVFLEINQMGQFLWLEEVNPAFPMLDLFLALLTGTLEEGAARPRFGLDFDAIGRGARDLLSRERSDGPAGTGNRVYESPPP